MFRYDIINLLIQRTNAKRYLEIGVQGGECFNQIRCAEKVSVDPNSPATYPLTSNAFFARHSDQRFDVVFVDGLHHREQVYQDILNSLAVLNPTGAVIVHDCDPPNEQAGRREACGGVWCGDVWQGWMDARIHLEKQCWTGVIDTDLGCGLILPWKRPQPVPHIAEGERTWAKFRSMRAEWLGLVGVEQFEEVLHKGSVEEMLVKQQDLMDQFEAMPEDSAPSIPDVEQ